MTAAGAQGGNQGGTGDGNGRRRRPGAGGRGSEADGRRESGREAGGGHEPEPRPPAEQFEDDLIRDPEFSFDEPPSEPPPRERQRPASDWSGSARAYAGYAGTSRNGSHGEQNAVDAVFRLLELVFGAAGDALPAETRLKLENVLRDFLVALRDALDRAIERLDEHTAHDVEIEEIPID